MRARLATALAAALLLVPLLAGCRPPDDRVRIRIWHQKIGAERAFFEEAVARYNAANPHVVVETLYRENEENRNLFIIAAVGGQGPELFFGPADNVGVLATTRTIRPLTDLFTPEELAAYTEDGVVAWNGQPWLLADQVGNHLMLVYNRALLPEPPTSLDALVQELRRITGEVAPGRRPEVYGLTWNYREPFFFIPFLTGFGGWVMDEAGRPTLDTPATVEAIRFILDLRDHHRVIPSETDYDTSEALFKEGRAAAIINGPWAWAGYAQAGIDFGIAPLPRVDATGRWAAPMVAAKGYAVNANVPDELLPILRDLLRFLTGEALQREMAERLATIPTLRSLREDEDLLRNPLLRASMEAASKGRAMPVAPQLRQIWDGMRGPYQLVMNGAVSPEEGARRMQREAEKRIADAFL